jgi:hypothetical protein
MTTRTLVAALALALAVIGIGCNSSTNNVTLDAPAVTAKEAANDGAALRITWNEVTDAESYEITSDDSVYTTTSTTYDVTAPSASVQIKAVKGTSKSEATTVSCGVVESTVQFYGDISNTAHATGFGFGTDGTALPCSLLAPSTYEMDFYADSSHGQMKLRPAKTAATKAGDGLKAALAAFGDLRIADAVGMYGDTALPIFAESTYCLRISPDTSGTVWSASDYFAKILVVSVDSMVSIKAAYQKIPGLRWLAK